MRKEENDSTNGGKKEALESVSPLPECNDHPEGGVPREELEEGEASQQDATVQELEKVNALMNAVLEAYQSIDGRVRLLERVINVSKVFRVDILSRSVEDTPPSSSGAQDARSALVFPEEKQECFRKCWFVLYADVQKAERLDDFFAKLRVRKSEDAFVDDIKRLVEDFPNLRENRFLRSQEGIEKLCSLLDSPFVTSQNIKNLSRRVTNNIKGLGEKMK
jgi:hypothetical protein